MTTEISDYGEASYQVDRTSQILQAALRMSESASGAVASYNRHPTKEARDLIFSTSLADSEILHELCFQCFVNLVEIRDSLSRLDDERLAIKRKGA